MFILLVGSLRDGDSGDVIKLKLMIGCWLYGMVYILLMSVEGVEVVWNFKIYVLLKLVDCLKKWLVSEVLMLEWENIEGDEFEDGFEDVWVVGISDGISGGISWGISGWIRVKYW